MGSCSSHEGIVTNEQMGKPSNSNKQSTLDDIDKDYAIEKENMNPKFLDMPEWEGDRYRGEGIKRMKGYKCDLQIDKLICLRNEFWNWKMKDKLIWKHLRQACLMDDGKIISKNSNIVRALHIITQLGLRTANGSLNHLIDEKNCHYYIPNFCINDPFFEKEFVKDCKIPINTTVIKVKYILFYFQ